VPVSRRRFLQLAAGVGAVSVLPGLRFQAFADGLGLQPADGEWLAGDFHVHTTWSHDVWGGPDDDNTEFPAESYTLGWTPAEQIRNAEIRGLHFVALTDHNRIKILDDPGYTSSSLTLVPGYEHSLSYGHAGVFIPDSAALRAVFNETLARGDGSGHGFGSPEELARFLDAIHSAGGVAVINHPADHGTWEGPIEASHGFDAVEAWNSSWLQRHNVTPEVYTDNYLAAQWWEDNFLGGDRRKGVTGGSDNHWRSTTAVQGVGQPTTWVFAADRSAAAIVEGVRAGRTFVSAQPPAFNGARVKLAVSEDWAGGQPGAALPGGVVRALGPLHVHADIENGAGLRLRLIAGGQTVADVPVSSPATSHQFSVVLDKGSWLRAELYADPGYAMACLTSAVYSHATDTAPLTAQRPPTTGPSVSYASPLDVIPTLA
jgi:predicted metal-dependent phosphoesterase TrpH